MVARLTPSSWPISATVLSCCRQKVLAVWALEKASLDNPLGRPPWRPRALAAVRPALVRSRMMSRSNSASETTG